MAIMHRNEEGKERSKKRFTFSREKETKKVHEAVSYIRAMTPPLPTTAAVASEKIGSIGWGKKSGMKELGGSIGRDRFILERVCALVFGDTKKDVSMIACERDEESAHVFLAKFRAKQRGGGEIGDLLVWPQFGGLFFSPSDCGNVHIHCLH